jgi:hypothetical protein
MGVDLTLMPLTADMPGILLAHTRIDLVRKRGLWEDIGNVPSRALEEPLSCFGEGGYCSKTKDLYGSALAFVRAGDLAKLSGHGGVVDNPTNRAAWAFVAALPSAHRVVLYWH